MNKTFNSTKIPVPPAFMATTRQKILLKNHQLQNESLHQGKTMNALNILGSVTRGILSLTKRA